jgi:hypothetical protein
MRLRLDPSRLDYAGYPRCRWCDGAMVRDRLPKVFALPLSQLDVLGVLSANVYVIVISWIMQASSLIS